MGTHSPSLCRLTIGLWDWCLLRQIYLSAFHFPGEDYLLADFLSRGRFRPSEWMFKTFVFQSICQVLSPPPEIDLFASLLYFLLPKFCSRSRDPQAWRVDTMSFPWSGLHLYAFPPFSMIPRVLEKVVQDEAELALIVPDWPRRRWFPKLLSLLAGLPRGLPCQSDLITQPLSQLPHRRIKTLSLAALRHQSKQAGLSDRAAEFSAEAIRDSTRATYDSKLGCFFEWCARIDCDPSSAS